MAAAAYATDLADKDLAQGSVWVEPTASGWTSVNAITNGDTDFFIQGTMCSSASVKTGVGALMTPAIANTTIPTDGALLIWFKFDAVNGLTNEANGGIRAIIGNSVSVFRAWKMLGSDSYAYGGWKNLAVNDTVAADYTVNSPASPWQRFGVGYNASAVPRKGNAFAVDACRTGRCEARFSGGTSPDAACTFAGFAAVNDNVSYRWGLLQAIEGGYLWKGLITLGYGAAVRFTDANTAVIIDNTTKVTANFNKIEIRNASSEINWTSIDFIALGTVSKGRLEVVDDCDVNIASCSFTGMDTFIFKAASAVLASAFRNCGQITANGASFAGSTFAGYEGTANTSYLIWNVNTNPDSYLSGCTFTKGSAATHAIEFGTTSPLALTLTNVNFSGYSASNNANDSAIHIKRGAGDTVTITISGGNVPSYRSDGATVNFSLSSVTVRVAVKTLDGSDLQGARVFLKASAAGHGLPFEATVTIDNVTGLPLATVTHTAHGMVSGDKVLIDGASLWQNNGVFTITRTGDNSYTYPLPEPMVSDPTGTIKATFVALEGLTDANGAVTPLTRSFGEDLPVVGWVRKSSSAPFYKPAALTGTIDSGTGYAATAIMISDQD